MPFWTYLLHCRGGVFYTGQTDDLDHRIAQHKSGLVPGFTSKYLPVELVWSQEFPTREEALAAERRIKGWSRAKKLALIRGDWDRISQLARGKSGPSTSSRRTGIEVAPAVLAQLIARATAAHPDECCGILLGEGANITAIVPTRNVHSTPSTHFEIAPQPLIDAHRAARAGGPQVIGYYHSHPEGPARPSATDHADAARDGRIWAIIGQSRDVTFWEDGEHGFSPLSYRVEGG
ncbi:Mov34/MPN/PAD-1 family protein [Alteraurantiacibacter aquimixticola]|uniref:M67 family peptidase n=1 Tax=Alteraurantiacibacter aquimixticola TaxID=2489173 RepID=A0A4T3F6H3_9SPHN|nr:Mov34/MPN/PAD-1 family protein [Alteraurantiacibacter aquimixticola]TIX51272.1 hypothetical protein E5222_02060 [Alteraurantiacibacter aquimixticola]